MKNKSLTHLNVLHNCTPSLSLLGMHVDCTFPPISVSLRHISAESRWATEARTYPLDRRKNGVLLLTWWEAEMPTLMQEFPLSATFRRRPLAKAVDGKGLGWTNRYSCSWRCPRLSLRRASATPLCGRSRILLSNHCVRAKKVNKWVVGFALQGVDIHE